MSTATISTTTTTAWTLDPVHSTAEFKVKHMMISNVKGHFTGIDGVLELDENDLTNSRVEAHIDAASIGTGNADRDAHLKSADFFDVERFPRLSFTSTRIARNRDGGLDLEGDLTIHGVTRPAVFSVEGPAPATRDPWGNLRIGLSAVTKISRKDFGLTWNTALETGGLLVGDDVTISIDVQFIKS